MSVRNFLTLLSALAFLAMGGTARAQHNPHNPHGAIDNPHRQLPDGEMNRANPNRGMDAVEHAEAHDHGHGTAPHGAPPINWTDLGYSDKNVHGGELQAGQEGMAPPLVWALINFATFFGLLYWKAGPALRKYLANRHESIKNALEEAAKLQEEAKEKMKEYSDRIKDADAEVEALIAKIRKDAEVEKAKIVEDAEKQADRLRKDAEARIESEFAIARRQLEAEVIAKASEAAERLLREKPSAADQNSLFTNFVSDLKSGKATPDSPGKGQA